MDHLDGAGVLFADHLLAGFCSSESGGGGVTDVTIDLNGGEPSDMPAGPAPYQEDWSSPGETKSFLQPADFNYTPGLSSGRKWQILEHLDLHEGTRFRVTWSWDGCAISDTGTAPAPVAIDFDIFLYTPTIGYVWASQSLDDSNEGFDYTVPAGEGATYQLILAWPDGSTGCEGGTFEPGAYSWMVGQ